MPIKITEKKFADEVWRIIASSPEGVSEDELETKVKQRLQLRTEFPYEFWILVENLLLPSLVIDPDEFVRPNLPDKTFYHSGDSRKLLTILGKGLTGRHYEDRPTTIFLHKFPSNSFRLRRVNKDYGSFMVEVNKTVSEQLGVPIVPVDSTGRYLEDSDTYGAHKTLPPEVMETVYIIGRETKWTRYLSSEVKQHGFKVHLVKNPRILGGMDRIVAEYHAYSHEMF